MSNATVYYTNFSEILSEEKIAALLPLVSKAKRERIETAKRIGTKASLLAGELLLRAALREDYALEGVEIAVDENGKPYLPAHPEIHFNLSHSEPYAVLVISDTPAGIDLEQISKPHDVMALAGKYLSVKEHAAMLLSPNPNEAFCRFWTLRESYVKMRGPGFKIGLSTLKTEFSRGVCTMLENGVPQTDAFFKELKTLPDYRISVCTKGEREIEVKKIFL